MDGHLQDEQLLTMWKESLFDPMANFFVKHYKVCLIGTAHNKAHTL